MTIPYKISVGTAPAESDKIAAIVRSVFDDVNRIYNNWNPDSEISKLNQLSANEKKVLSPQLFNLLKMTDRVVHLTEGKFDPTVGALHSLWRRSMENGEKPNTKDLAGYQASVGWDRIHFDEGVFWKEHSLTALDLCGIAKGYAVDLLIDRLNEQGYSNAYVEWGGEIKTSGTHPTGRPWRIFISQVDNPSPDEAVAVLDLEEQAIATSGDYLQKWEIGDCTYCHILDPIQGELKVVEKGSIASVSVLGKSCAEVDALATAVMLFPSIDKAQDWATKISKQEPDLHFWIISRSNR